MIRMGSRVEKASDYCTFCPKLCRFSCPVAQAEARETTTPWGLMSLLRMVRTDAVELSSEVGEAFFHCTGCLRCQTFCKHDNDIPEAMLAARRLLADRGIALPRTLQGMDLSYERFGSPDGAVPELPQAVIDAFDPDSKVAYLPEATRRGPQVDTLAGVGRAIEAALGHKAALIEDIDGQPIHDSGERLRHAGHAAWADMWQDHLVKSLEQSDLLIVESAEFAERWRRSSNHPRIVHLVELLVENLPALTESTIPPGSDGEDLRRIVYHDACSVGRRLELYEGPRILLEALLGKAPEELWLNREKSVCCGGGGVYPKVDPEGAERAAAIFAESLEEHGGDLLVTPDQGCRYHMAQSTGVAVMDLVELVVSRLK